MGFNVDLIGIPNVLINLLPPPGIDARPSSTTKQFAATVFLGPSLPTNCIWPQVIHYKRLLVFPVGPFKDSYNLNSFGGPGRNAYKSIVLLQKPGTQQSNSYRMELYKTFCRGHMIKAFVDKMVIPDGKTPLSSNLCVLVIMHLHFLKTVNNDMHICNHVTKCIFYQTCMTQ